MALVQLNIHQVFRVLHICGFITSAWPPESTAGKREIFLRDLGWSFAVLNILGTIITQSLFLWYSEHDIVQLTSVLSDLMATTEVLFNLILCRLGRTRLQKLIEKLRNFVKRSETHEMQVIQKYINRYSEYSVYMMTIYIIASIAFSFSPLFLSTNTPVEGWFPFPTDGPYVRAIIYIWQIFTIWQAGIAITVDLTIAMFFWYSSARLEMLGVEMQKITHESQMSTCIRKHQEIINFVAEVQSAVQYLICKSNITMGFLAICGAFPLVHKQPFFVTLQFSCMVFCGCQRLYVTAWPADDMTNISQQVAFFAYNTPWYEKSRKMATSVLILIQRSKKPLVISMGSMLPVLSLQYYASFLKSVSSYFMTMRAVIND